MIEMAGSYAGTYYYHFDALGSVVALTDDEGDTVQAYEYDVYGRVGATDANHPNRFMFTGREYDKETGLYYYRARYYNPQIGRFFQTDPIGYGSGMNLYGYCRNRPVVLADPSGLDPDGISISVVDSRDGSLMVNCADDMTFMIDLAARPDNVDIPTYLERRLNGIRRQLGWDEDKWAALAGIYFFAHGVPQDPSDPIPNESIRIGGTDMGTQGSGDPQLYNLCSMLNRVLPANTIVHMRTCDMARGLSNSLTLRDIALWTNRDVTAPQGLIHMDHDKYADGSIVPVEVSSGVKVADGSVHGTSADRADYTCDEGYVMIGPLYRTEGIAVINYGLYCDEHGNYTRTY